jgi:PAS domain S-box-containing protein
VAFQSSVATHRRAVDASRSVGHLRDLASSLHLLEDAIVAGTLGTGDAVRQLDQSRRLVQEAAGALGASQPPMSELSPVIEAYRDYENTRDRLSVVSSDTDPNPLDDGGQIGRAFLAFNAAVRRTELALLDVQANTLSQIRVQALGALLFGVLGAAGIGIGALRSITRSRERLRLFTDHASDLLWVVDTGGRILYCTPSVMRALGANGSTVGANICDAVHPDDLDSARAFLSDLKGTPGGLVTFNGRFRAEPSGSRHLEFIGQNLTNNRSVRGMVLNARDVTDRTAQEALLRRDASHDSLTQLPNRALFLDRAREALASSAQDPARTFAVVYLDLDGFKDVNDGLGHAAGDELLVAASERLAQTLRLLDRVPPASALPGRSRGPSTDTLARMGGDEFVVLLNNIGGAANALEAGTRLLSALNQPFTIQGRELRIAASLGIAVGPGEYSAVEELIRDADTAMYRAKAAGRSQVRMFDQTMQAKAARGLLDRGHLGDAIARQDFVLLYQPVVCMRRRTLKGFEAFVRWRYQGALIHPADFIPLAEDTGLVIPLGRWVVEQASRQAGVWRRAHPHLAPGIVTVNVCAKELADIDFLDHLDRAISEAGANPADLKLELTESFVATDQLNALAVVQQIRARGHKVTTDGFGTVHTLLSTFRQAPIDGLKLDRSFVHDLETSSHSANIASLLCNMAREAGLEVVAEGVENAQQVAILRGLGYTLAQGHFFAGPTEADQLGDTFLEMT